MNHTTERFNADWQYLAVKLGYPNKKTMLTDLYIVQGLSFQQISERLGCSAWCIGRNLEVEGIEKRHKGGRNNPSNSSRKLFLLDQRAVLKREFTVVARAAGVSTSLLYTYRKLMKGE